MGGALIGQTAVDQGLGNCAKSHKESSIAVGRKLHGRKLPLLGSLFGNLYIYISIYLLAIGTN